MSDKETLIAMLEKMGIERDEDCHRGDYPGSNRYFADQNSVVIGAGDGYSGFYARFEFDDEGNILSHGVWE